MTQFTGHLEYYVIREQLRNNRVLRHVPTERWEKLERMITISDYGKGAVLEHQGEWTKDQYFILSGVIKRVVASKSGKEMILRFAPESEISTSYAAWRLNTRLPYSICALKKLRVAHLPMRQWVNFIEKCPHLKSEFELEVMRIMSDVMAHTITLHLLNQEGRLKRFLRKHPDLVARIPQKDLAAYLNICPESLCRLIHRMKLDRHISAASTPAPENDILQTPFAREDALLMALVSRKHIRKSPKGTARAPST